MNAHILEECFSFILSMEQTPILQDGNNLVYKVFNSIKGDIRYNRESITCISQKPFFEEVSNLYRDTCNDRVIINDTMGKNITNGHQGLT
ncbi:hypothetical protein SAMN04488688_10790 [Paenibacillus sp. cl141a]|nr:hypothetical protein SAMN04488688_10790 [Paenibacillus sp. cl141a]